MTSPLRGMFLLYKQGHLPSKNVMMLWKQVNCQARHEHEDLSPVFEFVVYTHACVIVVCVCVCVCVAALGTF